MSPSIIELGREQLRFLFFQPVRIDLDRQFLPWLVFVVLVTWAVGIGRYWDHPSAQTWQYLGFGSVAYVFCLSALVYAVVLPLKPAHWRYRGVLVFVGLTSLPALLYAIPVERFVELSVAQSVNAWFLGLVAAWRVALFLRYLLSVAKLHWFIATTVVALLLSGIVVALSLLNLEHVVFDLMAGIRESDASPNDTAYLIVLGLAFFALYAFPISLLVYFAAIFVQRKEGRDRT